MNTYSKYTANVWLAKTEKTYSKGDIITLTTKYGKENEHEVFNLIYQKDGFNYYSIIRADGNNAQERARQKAERYATYQQNAENRARDWQEKSNEGADFLVLAEPIKIGHHSEKRHRALIERNHRRMDNAMNEYAKADSYSSKIEYWEEQAEKINLSMPESIEYFEALAEKTRDEHQFLKDNPDKRPHSMALQYANKRKKDAEKNYQLAVRLWG